jgi:hypothetical protein
MNQDELDVILDSHKRWLENDGGKRAVLPAENLSGANLRQVDLRRADLQSADLRGADLYEADLRGADLDFSVIPISWEPLGWIIDESQAIQILYHAFSMVCDSAQFNRLRNMALPFVNRFCEVEGAKELKPVQVEE